MKVIKIILILLVLSNVAMAQLPSIFKPWTTDVNQAELKADEEFKLHKSQGDYSVWYGCDINGGIKNRITKPFIYIEGIDLKTTL